MVRLPRQARHFSDAECHAAGAAATPGNQQRSQVEVRGWVARLARDGGRGDAYGLWRPIESHSSTESSGRLVRV
jgi:hypothetical protein